ncbi:hypothetical protein NQ317_015365 [Molorchus minor]|uniref:Uncharacterized protein n=1 Tax=Molorchus minor TaxID=1323400 RepID=A0ABQ9JDP2_9CUCU|nr:hypothetical protein NQ317_015365 [Molorchus minor]
MEPKKIVIERKAFYNIDSSSLLIEIQNCDELIIKAGAFEYIQSSVSIEIISTNFVTIQQAAFSKLYNSTFKDIKRMTLSEGSFDFKNQGNIGKHGPVTVISFDNVFIPVIPKEAFLTSLASVSFRNCIIGDLQTEAFKATEISAVMMINSSLNCIQEKAFTERTLIFDFKISKCNISKLQSKAILAAIANLTLSHSMITDVESRAIVTTVAKVEITDNQIFNFQTHGFVFNNWNRITIDNNIIKHLHSDFIEAPLNPDVERFSFKGNEIYILDQAALSFLSDLDERLIIFNDNYFNQSCDCKIDKWLEEITNNSKTIQAVMATSFCPVNEFLSQCFSLPVGIINIKNFTERSCSNFTICEPYNGETRTIDTTSKIFLQQDETEKQNWLIFIITIVALLITVIIVTSIILLIRGSRWLKRKGYFRNMHYQNNDQSNDDENTIVTVDENEKLDVPEEITLEFLQLLWTRLEDPATHQDASEMVERLYEMFVIEDGYENNNRQDEEAHLYEELGNLNLQNAPPPYEEERPQTSTEAKSILKLMGEKLNLQTDEQRPINTASALVGDYSEPTDAAIHLYSELKNKNEKKCW